MNSEGGQVYYVYILHNFLVLLSTTVFSQNINKQNVNIADETLTDYSFLSRYHYTKSRNYFKRRYRIRHRIPMFIGTPCISRIVFEGFWTLKGDKEIWEVLQIFKLFISNIYFDYTSSFLESWIPNPVLPGVFSLKVDPLNFILNIPVDLPSFLIKIWGNLVKGFMMSYDRTDKQTALYIKMLSFDPEKIGTKEDKNVAKLDKSKL